MAVLALIQSMAAAPSLESTANADTETAATPNSTHITIESNLERSALSAGLRASITNEVSSALHDTSKVNTECPCSHHSHAGIKDGKMWLGISGIILLLGITTAVLYNP